jgi:hypothetical protein
MGICYCGASVCESLSAAARRVPQLSMSDTFNPAMAALMALIAQACCPKRS